MGLNDTPSSNRIHIAFFGRRNSGKSSLVNAVTNQQIAIVSEIKGTTTDPVYKAMELPPLGPVVIIDTPGIDDEGELGGLRIQKTKQVLNKTDIAVIVLDVEINQDKNLSTFETELINNIKKRNIPYIIVLNKYDLQKTPINFLLEVLPVSAKTGFNINKLKEKITALVKNEKPQKRLIPDLIQPDDFVILVIHIDKAAPKGRLILPQQQVIRSLLDSNAVVITVKENELEKTLSILGKKPALVITDSQIFAEVSTIVPPDTPLTSFSILFAQYRGWLDTAVKGVMELDNLKDSDNILISEGCTHHRQCDDIGTVQLPLMIKNFCKKEPVFSFCSGGDFPEDLSPYKLIIHCGGCMLNEREMEYRRLLAEEQKTPFTNYGITIAHIKGILKRSIEIFNLPGII
jgi:[FeFe] hydrogenase H-cluster maturation GTPase HydF